MEIESPLTLRQIECLLLAAQGKTALEIAKALGISEHTVGHHLIDAQTRLGAVNRAQTVACAIRRGLI